MLKIITCFAMNVVFFRVVGSFLFCTRITLKQHWHITISDTFNNWKKKIPIKITLLRKITRQQIYIKAKIQIRFKWHFIISIDWHRVKNVCACCVRKTFYRVVHRAWYLIIYFYHKYNRIVCCMQWYRPNVKHRYV